MTVTFTPGTDFEDVCDGLEAVTLDPRTGDDVVISHALQRAVSTSEVQASDGKYLAGDVQWHLPVAECATRPTPGDVITDGDSEDWTILDVQEATLSRRWRCVCRNLAVSGSLTEKVDIEVATYDKDTGGAATESWEVAHEQVAARIQPAAASMEVAAGARRTKKTYTIWFAVDYDLKHNHRVKDASGNYYRITGYTATEEIGQLQQADAVREHA